MPVHKMTAAARALFDLEAGHSSESETESDNESERASDRAFIDVDALFESSEDESTTPTTPTTPSLRRSPPVDVANVIGYRTKVWEMFCNKFSDKSLGTEALTSHRQPHLSCACHETFRSQEDLVSILLDKEHTAEDGWRNLCDQTAADEFDAADLHGVSRHLKKNIRIRVLSLSDVVKAKVSPPMHVSKPVLNVQEFLRDKNLLKHMSFNKDVGVYFDPGATSNSVPAGRVSPRTFWDPRVRGFRMRLEYVKKVVVPEKLFGLDCLDKYPERLFSVTVGYKKRDLSKKMWDLVGEFAKLTCHAFIHGGERGMNLQHFHLQGTSDFVGRVRVDGHVVTLRTPHSPRAQASGSCTVASTPPRWPG